MKTPVWLCRLLRLKPEPPRGAVGVKWAGVKPPTASELDLLLVATAAIQSKGSHEIPGLTSIPPTPFLNYWPGEIVRHMDRPHNDGFLAGTIVEAGRDYISIQWENEALPKHITDPAVLSRIIKQPMPAFTQL